MAPDAMQDSQQQDHQITSVERIRDLIGIDRDISRILSTAGNGIRALSSHPSDTLEIGETKSVDKKEVFEKNTKELYAMIQSVSVRLRRQTYALEEANIIAADATSMESEIPPPPTLAQPPQRQGGATSSSAQAKPDPPMPVTNGGLGNLGVGWLNSRRDEVGKKKEEELWKEARAQLQRLLNHSDGHLAMDVDEREQDTEQGK